MAWVSLQASTNLYHRIGQATLFFSDFSDSGLTFDILSFLLLTVPKYYRN